MCEFFQKKNVHASWRLGIFKVEYMQHSRIFRNLHIDQTRHCHLKSDPSYSRFIFNVLTLFFGHGTFIAQLAFCNYRNVRCKSSDDFRTHISLLFLSLFIFNNTNWHAHSQHYISRLPIYISQNDRKRTLQDLHILLKGSLSCLMWTSYKSTFPSVYITS